jgi:nicotinamide-nucleotide amidase
MDAETVTVGNELLLGFTLDTNSSDIATALAAVGARIVRRTTVGDDENRISAAVGEALGRTGFVIVTGGLGPTRDDVTKHAVAALFDAPLELNEEYLRHLEARFAAHFRRGPMPATNRSQAEVPRGALLLPNRHGTAPGLWMEGGPGVAVLLPGVPHEMRALLADEVIPRMLERPEFADRLVTRSLTLRTAGITESGLASRLAEVEPSLEGVTLAYLPGFEGVDLRLTAWQVAQDRARELLEGAATSLRKELGVFWYGDDNTDMASAVLDMLRERHATLAVAESCTGGMIGGRITAIPGSSDVFLGGVVSYSDQSKQRDLDVPSSVLAQHGAVSEQTALAMAEGVARRFGADAAIAVTGVAGPSGGSPEKPVGTVWFAARMGDTARAVRSRLPGPREEVRLRAAQAGLNLLRRLLGDRADTVE